MRDKRKVAVDITKDAKNALFYECDISGDLRKDTPSMGDDNTIIGNVNPGKMGNGNTIIGPTDEKGNVILNQSMAVGRNAKAGEGSIAIGAGAMSGPGLFDSLEQLFQIMQKNGISEADLIQNLAEELSKPSENKNVIMNLWGKIEAAVTVGEGIELAMKVKQLILNHLQ
jgi:hypothetical protein